jgi:tetratricopeptide (TPR) repeat protein
MAPGSLSALLAELARAPEEPSQEAGPVRGTAIGRFELVRELGRGGFGVVWEARDRELDRSVALKLLRPGKKAELREERLRREADAAARLSHDNIVAIHDIGISEYGAYLVLELLRGKTLAKRLEEGPIALRDALRIVADVAKGVAHAHARGVVHRDLKPDNVFLCDDGRVKVLDFGLAHAFGQPRQPGGTPAYMAPEQWRNAPEDERTDVFALGAILYRMLANALPFAGERETVGSRRAPALEIPDAPGLGALVARTLEKDPVKRPRDAGEVLRELELHLEEFDRAKPGNAPRVTTRRHPRWRVATLVAVGAAAALAASTGYRLWPRAELPRVVVSVADFENNTAEKDLDGLSGMLITALEQSRRFSVLTRSRMIDLARQAGAERVQRIDEALGREICRRGEANALIVAAVHKFGDIYAIDVKIVDPQKHAYLMSFQERGRGRESIPGLVDKVSERARTGFSEKAAEVDSSRIKVSEAFTPNLEAYQHYFLGEGLLNGLTTDYVQLSPAREQFRKAVALDPGFAMAHYREAVTLVAEERDARASIAAAAARIGSLGVKERAYVLALQARIEKRPADAIARYEELLRAYPAEKEAHLLLAQLRCSLFVTDRSEFARGATEARAAIALDSGYTAGGLLRVGDVRAPGWPSAWEQLIQCEFFGGNTRGWLDAAREYARRVPSLRSMEHLGLAELAAGHVVEAVRAFEQANRTYPDDAEGILGLAAVRLKQDEFRAAEQEYRRLLGGSVERQREGWYGLSWTSAFRGRYREAVQRLDEVVRLSQELRDAPDLARAYGHQALWLSLASRDFAPAHEKIRRGLNAIDERVEPAIVYRHFYWFAITAALVGGRPDVADDLVQRSAGLGGNHPTGVLTVEKLRRAGDEAKAREVLRARMGRRLANGLEAYAAEWALSEKRYRDALDATLAAEAAPFWQHPDWVGFHASYYPRVLLLRAKARLALGQREAARADLDRLLGIWAQADAGMPALEEARHLRRNLALSRSAIRRP